VRQSSNDEPPQKKEKLTASLLAILLGDIGLHKFYLGQPFMGVLYLLFFWTFVPAVLGLLEGICYLSMKDEDFDKKYNQKPA
jgi:TM2 domain-containing membrane protein YozV